jgi:hypothetical protein
MSRVLQVAGLVVLGLVVMKLGCMCQQRKDKDLLLTAVHLSSMAVKPLDCDPVFSTSLSGTVVR